MKEKINIKEINRDSFKLMLTELSFEKYRLNQIENWIYDKHVSSFDEMSNISKAGRDILNENFFFPEIKVSEHVRSKKDGSEKFLFEFSDKSCVESVIMRYKTANSICISTQVGCKMGCRFCVSSALSFERDLKDYEMLFQLTEAERILGEKISKIVLMGIGEPLENYDNVVSFLRMLREREGRSLRNLSLSTCGLVPEILKLAEEKFPLTLSVSLHAATDIVRDKIMPINKKYNIQKLLDACKIYQKKTGRRLSFEFIMIKGLTDTDEQATELIKILRGVICHVNLIPANESPTNNYKQSDKRVIEEFRQKLVKNGIETTVRRTIGDDIDAACGQLRRKKSEKGGEF